MGKVKALLRLIKINNTSLLFLYIIFVFLLAINALLLKWATRLDFNTGDILIIRGISCFAIATISAKFEHSRLIPTGIMLQLGRMVLAGAILYCQAKCLEYIGTSTASMLSSMSLPFLILLAPTLRGRVSILQKLLSVLCLIGVIGVAIAFRRSQENPFGYLIAISGALCVAVTSIIIHSSNKNETLQTIAAVPAIASIIFGTLIATINHTPVNISPKCVVLFASGLLMYLLYKFTLRLYDLTLIHWVNFANVLVFAITLPLDKLLFNYQNNQSYIVGMLIIVLMLGMLTVTIRDQRKV